MIKVLFESFTFGLLLNPFTVLVLGGNLLMLIIVKWKTTKLKI